MYSIKVPRTTSYLLHLLYASDMKCHPHLCTNPCIFCLWWTATHFPFPTTRPLLEILSLPLPPLLFPSSHSPTTNNETALVIDHQSHIHSKQIHPSRARWKPDNCIASIPVQVQASHAWSRWGCHTVMLPVFSLRTVLCDAMNLLMWFLLLRILCHIFKPLLQHWIPESSGQWTAKKVWLAKVMMFPTLCAECLLTRCADHYGHMAWHPEKRSCWKEPCRHFCKLCSLSQSQMKLPIYTSEIK